MNIVFWNCQGLRPKRKELQNYLLENKIDILALNETVLEPKFKFHLPGYDIYKHGRLVGTKGGVKSVQSTMSHLVSTSVPCATFAELQTSQSYLPAARSSIQKLGNDSDVIFYVQNIIEHRLSWNKCYIYVFSQNQPLVSTNKGKGQCDKM